ncbi:MAG: phytanoyl-CoA dioxygenase family protein, partial [Pseudomonadota bacterium]|nr:phytanoyl-CoA dioxygenase family protein [Pseudomonadota bacterium]
ILDRVEQLIGPDIVLWGCQVFCKPASDGMEVPMHQDGHYWPIEPLATCTAWIAIDDSNVGNGCLRVVPGSHIGKRYYEHSKSDRENLVLNQHVDDARIDLDDAVDLELHPGQFSLHDVFLIHGSNPNTSGKRRAGVAIRYMPATSHFNRSLYETSEGSGYLVNFATRPLWLLRGNDRGNNNFQIGH